MAEIVLGTNNGFALRNWPEPAAWAHIIAKDLELKRVQMSFDLIDPTLPEPGRSVICDQIRTAVEQHGLDLTTTFTGLIVYAQNHLAHPDAYNRSQARRWYEAAFEVTSRLGAEATGGHVGAMSVADYADPSRRQFIRKEVLQSVCDLTRAAVQHGQKYFLWEMMPSPLEYPHTPEEVVEAMYQVNDGADLPVRLCFDLGHCAPDAQGNVVDPHMWLEELLPWTPVVHLQQTDGKTDRHWPFTPPYAGIGIVDPRRVVEIVRASPLPRVELLFELAHAFDAPPQQIVDEHRWSVDAFARWL